MVLIVSFQYLLKLNALLENFVCFYSLTVIHCSLVRLSNELLHNKNNLFAKKALSSSAY